MFLSKKRLQNILFLSYLFFKKDQILDIFKLWALQYFRSDSNLRYKKCPPLAPYLIIGLFFPDLSIPKVNVHYPILYPKDQIRKVLDTNYMSKNIYLTIFCIIYTPRSKHHFCRNCLVGIFSEKFPVPEYSHPGSWKMEPLSLNFQNFHAIHKIALICFKLLRYSLYP